MKGDADRQLEELLQERNKAIRRQHHLCFQKLGRIRWIVSLVGMAAREVDSMGPIFLGWQKVLDDRQKFMAVMCSPNYPKELGKAK